jgi:hypothetical protein
MVTIQQIERGVQTYIEMEIAQKAVGIQKFATYFLIPQIPKKIEQLFSKHKDGFILKDFLDENANIDLDALYNSAKTAIRKSGQIEMFGIIFTESDIDKLNEYIKRTTMSI